MAFNGSGTYSLYTPGNPVVTGTTISSTWANNTLTDIATALTTCLTKDGQTTPTANLPMGGFKLTGLASGSARTDSATLANLQDGTGIYVATVGGTADVITLTPSPAITAYAAGQAFSWIASGANTGATTVNVSAVGAKAVTKNGTTALAAGDIASGALVTAIYDGTRFQVVAAGNVVTGAVTTSGLTMATARLLGRTTASTGAIEEMTVGTGLTLSGGSLVANAPATRQTFASGSGTYTTPANCRSINVRMLGGGGGGAAAATNAGTAGGDTTFSTFTASGGAGGSAAGGAGGAGGSAAGGDINIAGGSGAGGWDGGLSSGNSMGGAGGSSAFGGGQGATAANGTGTAAPANSGGGGSGGGNTGGGSSGGGGGAGGYVEKLITTPAATYSYAVGAAGGGGAAGTKAGGNGGSGLIIVDEYY